MSTSYRVAVFLFALLMIAAGPADMPKPVRTNGSLVSGV